jgi:AraC-like DNA-binding protein
MAEKVQRCNCIKFCQKLGYSCSGTHNIFQKTFGSEAIGHTQVNEWCRCLKEGRTSVEGDEHSGRPSMSRNQLIIDKVHFVMRDNHRITIRELSDELGFSLGLVQSIWTEDLNMKRVSAKSVPKLLTVESHPVHNFLAKHQIPYMSQPRIHQTWAHMTFF